MSSTSTTTALSLYRKLYRQCMLIPRYDKQRQYLSDIRKQFDAFVVSVKKNENTEAQQQEFINKMNDKLSFIQMTTPKMSNLSAIKHIHDQRVSGFDYSNHGTREIYIRTKDGEVVDVNKEAKDINLSKDKAAVSNWGYGNIDPDQLKRHEQLLRRQHFQEGPLKNYPQNVYGWGNK